jgi:stearoyl-CoA desaturase (Delta-9 desaturase)
VTGATTAATAATGAVVHTLPAAPFKRAQRRHFVFAVLAPTALALLLPLLLPAPWSPWHTPGAALGLLATMWFLVGGVGVSVGLHRLFSHRSFEATPALRWVLGALGAMAAQGPLLYWVALHRMHHAASDRPGDPHSPRTEAWPGRGRWRAAWQGHLGWVLAHDVPKPTRYARELIADPLAQRLGRAYPACVAAGLLLPAAAGALWLGGWAGALFGAYWGGIVRIAFGHHVIWAINSWCHLAGRRPHATSDGSGNVAWLALPSWGESWHNNHHADPVQARFGRGWREPDIGWWVVHLFMALGWARPRA